MVNLGITIVGFVHVGCILGLYFKYSFHLKRVDVLFKLLNNIYHYFEGSVEELPEFILNESKKLNKKTFLLNFEFRPKVRKSLEYKSEDYKLILKEFKRERRMSAISIAGTVLLAILFVLLLDFYEVILP